MTTTRPTFRAWLRAPQALVLSLVVVACSFSPSSAWADEDVLAGSPVVRKNLMYRAARHEVSGMIGMSLADPYVRNVLPGARYDYHLFDWLSVGGRLQVGIPVRTNLYDEIDTKVTANNDTFAMEASTLRFVTVAHVSVSPLVGKLLAGGSFPIQFDVHLDLMGGVVGVGSTGDDLPTGVGLALGAAGGVRVFLSRVLALNIELQALSSDRAMSVNRDSKETGRKTRFSTIFNVGVSFFMPPILRRAK